VDVDSFRIVRHLATFNLGRHIHVVLSFGNEARGMTTESQRIAIAEACGWIHTDENPFERHGTKITNNIPKGAWHHPVIAGCKLSPPDYLKDLNAMHEAEKVMAPEQCKQYERWLGESCNRVWHATAAQRAEAFLRTIGKWERDEA
jgi:hypothetical protein